jgi:hypothetical protein
MGPEYSQGNHHSLMYIYGKEFAQVREGDSGAIVRACFKDCRAWPILGIQLRDSSEPQVLQDECCRDHPECQGNLCFRESGQTHGISPTRPNSEIETQRS